MIGLLVLAAGGTAAVVTLTGQEDGAGRTAASQPAGNTAPDEPSADASDPETSPVPPEPTADAEATTPSSTLEAGSYVQLASFRTSTRAEEVASDLQADGIDAEVVSSDETRELIPGFFIIVAGPTTSSTEERRIVRRAKRNRISDAFVQQLNPDTAPADASALNGRFTGRPLQNGSQDPSLQGRVRVLFDLTDDGASGTVIYSKPDCTGDLAVESTSDRTFVLRETIKEGSCEDGSWLVKAIDGELAVHWSRDDEDYRVYGRLTPEEAP